MFFVFSTFLCVFAAARTATADEKKPAVVTSADLSLNAESSSAGLLNTLAVYPGATKVYSAPRYTFGDRRNLIVATLGPDGRVVGKARRYFDTDKPLPLSVTVPELNRTVDIGYDLNSILPDAAKHKLYLSHSVGLYPQDTQKLLTVYDLDATGEPVGVPRTCDTHQLGKSASAMIRHPRLNLLYLAGNHNAALLVYRLDANGNPQNGPQSFDLGFGEKYALGIGEDGKHLYVSTRGDGIQVVTLDAEGLPTGTSANFRADEGGGAFAALGCKSHALYMTLPTPQGSRLAEWPLDDEGKPVGQVKVHEEIPASAFALDAARNLLWIVAESTYKDAITAATWIEGTRTSSYRLKPDGGLGDLEATSPIQYGTRAVTIAVGSDGSPAMLVQALESAARGNLVKDYRLRATVLAARLESGEELKNVPMQVTSTDLDANLGDIPIDAPSRWTTLDNCLKGIDGQQLLRMIAGVPSNPPFAPATMARLKVRIDVAEGDPDQGGKLLKSMTEEVQGNTILFFVPGYAMGPMLERARSIELFSDHALKYLETAKAVAVPLADRPKLFNINTSVLGGQGSIEQLQLEAETVAALGCNTVGTVYWGNIPRKDVDQVLDSQGLQRRSLGIYMPPTYFAYAQDKMSPEALTRDLAKPYMESLRQESGAKPSDIVQFAIADEPGWYYPRQFEDLRKNPSYMEQFHLYLQRQKMTPELLGATSWDEIKPLGASGAKDLPSSRLFYWTMRFFTEQASAGLKLTREAIEREVGHPVAAMANFNNWGIGWYVPSPNQRVGNDPTVSPDSASGGFDWFESGRQNAHTIWTEDWFGTDRAQNWSYYTDLMRSASMLGKQPYGGYLVCRTVGTDPDGASYKVLAMLGHGAKELCLYTFGPAYIFGNGFSELYENYGPIAKAMRRVGQSERLLYPGKPSRGKVAIQVPGSSLLWESSQRIPIYVYEHMRLQYALTHSGYTVDFVDEKDLAGEDWKQRGYTTLYLTGPNLMKAAQQKVAEWVQSGGTLVAGPGAATMDEYNTPCDILNKPLGLKSRPAMRDADPAGVEPAGQKINFADSRFGARSMGVHGPLAKLDSTTSTALATVDGAAAISANVYGKGRGIAYGIFPGREYWITADSSDTSRFPRGWGAAQRQLAIAPVIIAKTPRPVKLDQPVIEACRLESKKGIAIVLLNWGEGPVSKLGVEIPNVGKFTKISSMETGLLKTTVAGNGLKVNLPLKTVDVLFVE